MRQQQQIPPAGSTQHQPPNRRRLKSRQAQLRSPPLLGKNKKWEGLESGKYLTGSTIVQNLCPILDMKTNSFVDEGVSSVQDSMAAQVNPPTAVDTSSWVDDQEGADPSTAVPWKKQFARG